MDKALKRRGCKLYMNLNYNLNGQLESSRWSNGNMPYYVIAVSVFFFFLRNKDRSLEIKKWKTRHPRSKAGCTRRFVRYDLLSISDYLLVGYYG